MTTLLGARAQTRPRGRVWARVLSWALVPENARLDFTIIAALNVAIGLILALWPELAGSPSLAVLMALVPRLYWAAAFLLAGALALAGLRCRDDRSAGRLRHYAWTLAGALLAMWLAGVLFGTGSAVGALVLGALLAWYTLTAARLELPRVLRR